MTALPLSLSKHQWLASLELDLNTGDFGTQLVNTKRQGPLSIQKPFYPEGRECAHLYLLHPPAGIVSGDDLSIAVNIGKRAQCLITTPGANRFYRAREQTCFADSKQKLTTCIHLSEDSRCEYFPLETIVYDLADASNNLDVYVERHSVYMGWDIVCLGLPSAAQLFENGKLSQRTRIYCQQKLIYHDRFAIQPDSPIHKHPAGLHNFSVFGTFLAYIPDQLVNTESAEVLVNTMRDKMISMGAEELISITRINGLIITRYLGSHAEQCKTIFIALWKIIRPASMDKPAIVPRIWHT